MATFNQQIFVTKLGDHLVIRHITDKDVFEVKKFLKQIGEETSHTLQYVGRELPDDETYAKKFADGAKDYLVLNVGVFDGGSLIAFLQIRPYKSDHPWTKHIAEFGVMILKKYWGHGVGRRLLQLQEEHAVSVGFRKIEALVRANNERGIKLYTSSGYKIEGTRRAAVMIDNKFQDEYYIAKILDTNVRLD